MPANEVVMPRKKKGASLLNQPAKWAELDRLVPTITLYAIVGVKKSLAVIESEILDIQRKSSAQDSTSTQIVQQLEGVRQDEASLHHLIDEVRESSQRFKDNNQDLSSKLTGAHDSVRDMLQDQHKTQTANIVRINQALKSLEGITNCLQQRTTTLEKDLQERRTDSYDIKSTIAKLETSWSAVDERYKIVHARIDQQSEEGIALRHEMAKLQRVQQSAKNFVDRIAQHEDELIGFIDSLSAGRDLNQIIREDEVPHKGDGPHKVNDPHEDQFPTSALEFANLMSRFNRIYPRKKQQDPNVDSIYILKFLDMINPRAAIYVQQQFQKHLPRIAKVLNHPVEMKHSHAPLFVCVRNMTWAHVVEVVRTLDLGELAAFVDAPSSGIKRPASETEDSSKTRMAKKQTITAGPKGVIKHSKSIDGLIRENENIVHPPSRAARRREPPGLC
ncbi:hypothetical protein F5Y15DRAFT_19280 [Xylariaceae sp. FL0016]|nr:hypothetical protein F5Y15DRAFT_19280 [Xylariaceae sp. FL0016]